MAEAIARVTHAEVSSVKLTMRFLREAGFLTHGAHGVNAPDMTALDLARTLIAHIAWEKPGNRSVSAATEIGAMTFNDPDLNTGEFTLEALRGLKPPFTFAEALAALIEVYAFEWETDAYRSAERQLPHGKIMPPSCQIDIFSDEDGPGATIKMGPWEDSCTGTYLFSGPLRSISDAVAARELVPPVTSLRSVSERNIKPLAEEFAGMA